MQFNGDQSDSQNSIKKRLSEDDLHQINVLRTLGGAKGPGRTAPQGLSSQITVSTEAKKEYHIQEIAELCGLKDEKEVQRYLFILEGQKYVSPSPQGDFTSKVWQITSEGARVLKDINKSGIFQ